MAGHITFDCQAQLPLDLLLSLVTQELNALINFNAEVIITRSRSLPTGDGGGGEAPLQCVDGGPGFQYYRLP